MKGKNEHKEARKDCSEQSHRVNGRNDYQDFKCFGQKWSLDHLENEKNYLMGYRVPSEKKHWRNKKEIPLSGAVLWTLQMKQSDVCWWILKVHKINPCDTVSWKYGFIF